MNDFNEERSISSLDSINNVYESVIYVGIVHLS